MSAPKVSAMENEPRNLTIGTLIRVAHWTAGWKSSWCAGLRRSAEGGSSEGEVKTRSLKTDGCGTCERSRRLGETVAVGFCQG